ncbi:MAG: hypothetical protein J6K52_04565 [Clostridia bacterium]|nr:hypothetical protein [Clostridia bacterium]MBQ7788091.1 hypothetical protein [Clostridia bacterium]
MSKEKSTIGSVIKGIAFGAVLGTIATMVLSNTKVSKKIKDTAENAVDNVSSMFKMN